MFIDVHTHKLKQKFALHNVIVGEQIVNNETWFSAGIHPNFIGNIETQKLNLNTLALSSNCLAIGECGLDKNSNTSLQVQKEVFIYQISFAKQLSKPLIIHCVKSFDEVIAMVHPNEVKCIIHGFNKNVELAKNLVDKGFYISLGKFFLQSNATHSYQNIPLEKVFLETDDADISIEEIYKLAAIHFNCELGALQNQIKINFEKFFEISLK